jgi:hypothetical protein
MPLGAQHPGCDPVADGLHVETKVLRGLADQQEFGAVRMATP